MYAYYQLVNEDDPEANHPMLARVYDSVEEARAAFKEATNLPDGIYSVYSVVDPPDGNHVVYPGCEIRKCRWKFLQVR